MRSDLRPYVSRPIIANLDDDHAITGTLTAESPTAITLSDAALVGDGRDPTPMDGVILIERIRILWIQAL